MKDKNKNNPVSSVVTDTCRNLSEYSDNSEYVFDCLRQPSIIPEKRAVALAQGNWDYFLQGETCCERVITLNRLADKMLDFDYWFYLRKYWNKGHCKKCRFNQELLVAMMQGERPNSHLLMRPHEHAVIAALPEEFWIYRGCTAEHMAPHWSWSLSCEVARKFARSYSEDEGVVLRGRCLKKWVIAYFQFEGHNEKEIVAPPDSIFGLEWRTAPYFDHAPGAPWNSYNNQCPAINEKRK